MNAQIMAAPFAEEIGEARAAQAPWGTASVAERLRVVHRAQDLLYRHQDRLTAAVQQDLGRDPAETLSGEIFGVAEACRFLRRRAKGLLRARRVSSWDRPVWLMGQTDWIARRPRGVVAIIGTWNFPIYLNAVQILQALTAGNAVVWKPSEVAPATAKAVADWLGDCGLPEGLFQQLPLDREAGKLLSDAEIDYLIFTGHANTGRLLAAHLGRRLIPSTLELSGCDAMFVLEDANVKMAAQAAWFSTTMNSSQTCIAARRCFVHRRLYEPFLEELKKLSAQARPLRLATPGQISTAEDLIDDALASGARLLNERPAEVPQGTFMPTILIDVNPSMGVCRRDTFAPLLAVLPFDDQETAVKQSKECDYDLGASVFTSSRDRGQRLAEHLGAGMVTLNDLVVPTAHPATPFGGRRASGWGSTQGAEGLLELTVPQVVSWKSGTFRPHYLPAGSSKVTSLPFFQAIYQWQYAPSFPERLSGFFRLIGTLLTKQAPAKK